MLKNPILTAILIGICGLLGWLFVYRAGTSAGLPFMAMVYAVLAFISWGACLAIGWLSGHFRSPE